MWTCFHCGETFTTIGSASDHFGATPEAKAGCLIDRVALEEGGKPERGRGLLMALRKAEAQLQKLTTALDTIARYPLPVFEIEGHGRMVPVENADHLRTVAKEAL